MSSDSCTVFFLEENLVAYTNVGGRYLNVYLRVLMPVSLPWPGCCPKQIWKLNQYQRWTSVWESAIKGCEFLLLLTLFQCSKLLLTETNVSHPCLVTVSSCTLCFLSWSPFVLFHLPIPTDCRTVLAEYTLLLTKVEELQFYCVWVSPPPLFLCTEKYSLTSALFSWQERWVAPVCWPAIVPDGYLFWQPVVVCQLPLTGCCSESL